MTTIGLIGSGHIGSTLARLAVDAGLDVVLSNSRGPETLADLARDLGPRARTGTTQEAAHDGDIVVVTIPLRAFDDVPAEALTNKIVVDTCNYYPDRDGEVPALEDESTTTSELLQERLPESHVVKAFNNIYFAHLAALARPSGSGDRTALPIAGDDASAKKTVVELLDQLGYDAHDVGPLAEGWRFQRDLPAYAAIYATDGDFERPRQVTATELGQALAQARRYRDL